MKKITTKSEKETFEFAKEFAKSLKGGEVLGLIGNLGAGKTIFSKGIAEGLNIKEEITSPTFVYMKVYEVGNHSSIKKICHIDAYRIKDEHLLINIGALEYFNNPEVVTIVEWADKVEDLLSDNFKQINFEIKGNDRILRIE